MAGMMEIFLKQRKIQQQQKNQQRTKIINVKMTQNIRYLAQCLSLYFPPFDYAILSFGWVYACVSVLFYIDKDQEILLILRSSLFFLFASLYVPLCVCVCVCCANTFDVNFRCFRFASKSEVKSRKR